MTALKTYPITCRVCGTKFDLHAEFVSGLSTTPDGRLLGSCNMAPEKMSPHTAAELSAALKSGVLS